MKFLIEFKHDSKHLGFNGYDHLLVDAESFEQACEKIKTYRLILENSATGYKWSENYINAREFRNKTI